MKKSLLTTLLLITSIIIFSQNYEKSFGARTGYSNGITAQLIIDDNNYLSGILSFRNNGIQLTGLRQYYKELNIKDFENLQYYYGFGAHVGYSNKYHIDDYYDEEYYFKHKQFCPELGIDGNIGIEYHFTNLPFAIGLDYKPFLQIIGNDFLETSSDWGMIFKYTIN